VKYNVTRVVQRILKNGGRPPTFIPPRPESTRDKSAKA
jgi:hypothetical protein